MPLALKIKRNVSPQVSVKLTQKNREMLEKALGDHPILSNIVNAAVDDYLTRHGYARKRETTS